MFNVDFIVLIEILAVMHSHAKSPGSKQPHRLWFRKPADFWEEGLVLGNGRLGAVVFGGAQHERILLNEESLYAGDPANIPPPTTLESLQEVRRLIRLERYAEADRFAERELYGPYTQPYQPMGNLWLEFEGINDPTGYSRELDLHDAVARIAFQSGTAFHKREVFVSHPDNALVLRIESIGEELLNFWVRFKPDLRTVIGTQGDELFWSGSCPSSRKCWGSTSPTEFCEETAVRFASRLKVLPEGGVVAGGNDFLKVEQCRAVTIIFCARSSYRNQNYEAAVVADLEQVARTLMQVSAISTSQMHHTHQLRQQFFISQ